MKKTILLTGFLSLMSIFPVHAKVTGHEGGGGDAAEIRVNEIRSDILKWLNDEGGKELEMPKDLSYGEYFDKMTDILQPKKVVIGFVEKDSYFNDELKVNINGVPKTCRGFVSKKDLKHHILCNLSRFKDTSESEQYKLIHHEYAGLVNIEKNEGGASDYFISSQITDFLKVHKVLKLAVKKVNRYELMRKGIANKLLQSNLSCSIDSNYRRINEEYMIERIGNDKSATISVSDDQSQPIVTIVLPSSEKESELETVSIVTSVDFKEIINLKIKGETILANEVNVGTILNPTFEIGTVRKTFYKAECKVQQNPDY